MSSGYPVSRSLAGFNYKVILNVRVAAMQAGIPTPYGSNIPKKPPLLKKSNLLENMLGSRFFFKVSTRTCHRQPRLWRSRHIGLRTEAAGDDAPTTFEMNTRSYKVIMIRSQKTPIIRKVNISRLLLDRYMNHLISTHLLFFSAKRNDHFFPKLHFGKG